MEKNILIEGLKHGLIISCQPRLDSPLDHPKFIAALAAVAEQQGAVAVRIQGPRNIRAVRDAVGIPVLGIEKINDPESPVYITPTLESVRRVHRAGAQFVALDATERPRPRHQNLAGIVHAAKAELGAMIMADVASLRQGLKAAELGVDLISTTLYGYTEETRRSEGPALRLLRELVQKVNIPVILEGRIHHPAQVRRAFELGAYAVVVGTAITDVEWLARRFIGACPGCDKRRSSGGR